MIQMGFYQWYASLPSLEPFPACTARLVIRTSTSKGIEMNSLHLVISGIWERYNAIQRTFCMNGKFPL